MAIYKPSGIERKLAKLSFGYKQRKDLYNQLISLMSAGLQQTDAVQMAWDVASEEGKKPKETLAIVLQDIILRLQDGHSMAKALKPWVPADDVMVFEAIENSDDFVGYLREYMVMLEKKRAIVGTIVGGMIYPIILIGAVMGIITYFGNSLVPIIDGILPMEKWQGVALVLVFMNAFAQHYLIPTIITILVVAAVITFSLPRWAGRGRAFADRLPIYSTYRMYTGISFLMSMSSLIQGGMSPSRAIDLLRTDATPYVAYRLKKVRNQMLNGNNFGAALHRAGTGWPDRKMNLNIKIFAETQDLSAQLSKLSLSWIDEAQKNIKASMALVRNLAMMLVGAALMGIVGGIFALQGQISNAFM